MKCKHEIDESFIPEDIPKGVWYMIPCKNCGYHLGVKAKGDDSKPKEFRTLPVGDSLNIPFNFSPDDLEVYKKYKHVFERSIRVFTDEETMEILYEMLADGDIDMDQFNKYSVKLMSTAA